MSVACARQGGLSSGCFKKKKKKKENALKPQQNEIMCILFYDFSALLVD